MSTLVHLIEYYGLAAVFLNVLIEQLGAPLPPYPTLIVTGALLGRGAYSLPMLLLTAVGAMPVAFIAGKWWQHGRFIRSLRLAREVARSTLKIISKRAKVF